MMIKKWMAAVALMTMSTGALADGVYDFDSITSLTDNGRNITGVLVGDTVPTTVAVTGDNFQCFEWLQLMLKQPGMFTLNATVITSGGPITPPITKIEFCKLTAKP